MSTPARVAVGADHRGSEAARSIAETLRRSGHEVTLFESSAETPCDYPEQAWKVDIEEIKARNYNLDFKNPHTVADDHGDPAELLAKLEQDEQKAAVLRDQLKVILAEALLR